MDLFLGPCSAISRGMTIKIGTIQEMTGEGYEILVDSETRSLVLAKFYDGNLVGTAQDEVRTNGNEKTVVTNP
jgi:hypothetical protein